MAVLLGLADHRLVPGGIVVELQGGGIELAELLEPVAPGRGVEPRDRQAGLHPVAGPGLDAQRQVVDALVRERLGDGPGPGFAEVVDGGDRPAVGREGDVMNGVAQEPRWANRLRRGRVAEPDRAVRESRDDQGAIAAKRRAWAGDEAVIRLARTRAGRGVAELDRAVSSRSEEGTTVRTESAGHLADHGLTDRLPSRYIPEPDGDTIGVREQGSTIRPELHPGDVDWCWAVIHRWVGESGYPRVERRPCRYDRWPVPPRGSGRPGCTPGSSRSRPEEAAGRSPGLSRYPRTGPVR